MTEREFLSIDTRDFEVGKRLLCTNTNRDRKITKGNTYIIIVNDDISIHFKDDSGDNNYVWIDSDYDYTTHYCNCFKPYNIIELRNS